LRFLIRRAIRNGKLLGYPTGFMTALVPAVVKSLESGYPELRAKGRTDRADPRRGGTRVQPDPRARSRAASAADRARADGSNRLSGRDAFELHDTYGFPVELTREIASESGVDLDLDDFEAAMREQRERARSDASSKRATVGVTELPAIVSEYTGYEGSKPTAR